MSRLLFENLSLDARRELATMVADQYGLSIDMPIWVTLLDRWRKELPVTRQVIPPNGDGTWGPSNRLMTIDVREEMRVYIGMCSTPCGPVKFIDTTYYVLIPPAATFSFTETLGVRLS